MEMRPRRRRPCRTTVRNIRAAVADTRRTVTRAGATSSTTATTATIVMTATTATVGVIVATGDADDAVVTSRRRRRHRWFPIARRSAGSIHRAMADSFAARATATS